MTFSLTALGALRRLDPLAERSFCCPLEAPANHQAFFRWSAFLRLRFLLRHSPSHPKNRNGPPVVQLADTPDLDSGGPKKPIVGSTPTRGTNSLWLAIAEPLSYCLLDRLRDALAVAHLARVVAVLKLGDVAV